MHKHSAWNNIMQDLPYISYSLPLWKMVKCHQQSDQNYPARKATDRGRNVSKIRSDWHNLDNQVVVGNQLLNDTCDNIMLFLHY